MRRVLSLLLTALVAVTAIQLPAADAESFASLDQPGPALEAPTAELESALTCHADLSTITEDPVVLIPGTALSAATNYGWNWIPALTAAGIPVCTVELHERGMGDLQRSAENVVHAVLSVHERSGRPVRLIGYSQGGLNVRWVLRFWPEVRAAVSEAITLAGVHNGATTTDPLCVAACAASLHQMRPGGMVNAAVNSRATTFDGIPLTSIFSRLDELATPSYDGTASTVVGATTIALQDVCPANIAEHLAIGMYDPVAFALALDALTHEGPASIARVPTTVCTELMLPGIDPIAMVEGLAAASAEIATGLALAPLLPAEPALRCYVTASCGASPPASPSPSPPADTAGAPAHQGTRTGPGRLPATGSSVPVGLAGGAFALGLVMQHLVRRDRRPTSG